ncbi:glycoside hydrolase family 88 protein [Pendulispora rubella]|uniref:Glycoside hydrolase family 88 protein n=1 Tax=Pendulispora rubella TaxID=2741070 RepID=A0ABZ2KSX9_9BACT
MSLSRRALLTSAAGAAVAAGTLAKNTSAAAATLASGDARTLKAAADYAISKLRVVAPAVTGFPLITKFEKWAYTQNGDWVGGFWPGTLWLAWLYSGEAQFKTLAQDWADKLAPRRTDTGTHDLGFLFYPSWVTAWRLTGEDKWRAGAIQAASSLIQRYNSKGHFIRAWGNLSDPGNAGRVIIDTMMNLDLLAFATEQTGDATYLDIATEHAKTAQRVFLRPDGSIPHVYDFNPSTGAPIGPNTVQGYSPTSCWSRGQAWGIYGFTTMYRRTGNAQFLTTATRLADFALSALTPDNVPVWDYLAPQAPNDIKDASAGTVMACGLLDLANASQRSSYRAAAIRILTAISQTCLTTKSTRAEAIVARCTRNRPSEDGIEVSVPYGDYYLLEGILRILKPAELAQAIGL